MARVYQLPHFTNEFTLSTWLIEGNFHPFWKQWYASLVHLRGECKGQPAKLQFPEATHEFVVFAHHPDTKMTPESRPEDGLKLLQPPDIAQQFIAESDTAALERIEKLLNSVRHDVLSPDQDFRATWRKLLR